jgi:DNA-binding PadR family transcriptional regulator
MMTNVILDDDQVLRILRILRNKEFCTVDQVGEGLKSHGVIFTHAQVYTRLEKLTKSIPPYADRVQVGIRNHYRITEKGREMIAPGEELEKVNVKFGDIIKKILQWFRN